MAERDWKQKDKQRRVIMPTLLMSADYRHLYNPRGRPNSANFVHFRSFFWFFFFCKLLLNVHVRVDLKTKQLFERHLTIFTLPSFAGQFKYFFYSIVGAFVLNYKGNYFVNLIRINYILNIFYIMINIILSFKTEYYKSLIYYLC